MPGKKMRSIRNTAQYEHLRSIGFTKSSAAAISNASANKKRGKRKSKK